MAEESEPKQNTTDADTRKIFVGGLSWETTAESMKAYFEKFGKVTDCILKTDPTTGRSRGFGFVQFEEADTLEKVLCDKSHTLNGRTIDPKRVKGKEVVKKVFVGGLDPSVSEADIREHFGEFGAIEQLELPFDKVNNKRRAFIFITFETGDAADKCCVNAKQTIGGKEVDVRKATPKSDEFGGRGGRGGFNPRGRGRGGYDQGGYGGYDYGGYYPGYNGYDYYNQGYGYDPSGYYGQGYGGYGGYGGYDYSGYYGGSDPSQYGKARRGSNGASYHPYAR